MAVPIRVSNIPEYLSAPQYSHHNTAPKNLHSGSQEVLQFPKSTCVLWDGTSTGPPVFLHVTQNRKPKLLLWEKLLWLIHKQVDNEGSIHKRLIASLSIDEGADGVSFKIDRLDTRQPNVNTSLLQDDVQIPVQVSSNSAQDNSGGSKEDYAEAIKMLEKGCCSQESLELNKLLLVKGWCSVRCHQHAEKAVAHMQFDLVTLANVFKATPVNPVPIIPSALAKNLSGPRSLSHQQGRPKMGYLSMDATRKLLLVLESDPKVSSLPIVGIWVSGVTMVHHPFVWGSCVRYLQNERLQDRVCTPPEGFLLMVYSSLHSKPEFYEVHTTSGKSGLEYDLYTGYEVTTLCKKSSGSEPVVLEWELNPVRNGPKREVFDAALQDIKSHSQAPKTTVNGSSLSVCEDTMPRMTPAPHQSKAMTIRPMVPELSMIWTDDNSPSPSFTPFSCAAARPPDLNTAFTSHNSAFNTPASGFNSAMSAFNPPASAFNPPASAFNAPASAFNAPASAFNALASAHRRDMGSVPSSLTSCPAPSVMATGSGAGNSYGGHSHGSECMPRAAFPAQYQQPQAWYDQNNCARTEVPVANSLASVGNLTAAYRNCIAPSAPGHNPAPYSQPGKWMEYGGGSVPLQSQASAAVHQLSSPQQHMSAPLVHNGFKPQPQNHAPRLMAPAAMHFCRPNQASPAVRPETSFPHPPPQHFQRPPRNNLLPATNQGQHGPVPVPSSHPSTQSQPMAGHHAVHPDHPSMPHVYPRDQPNTIPGLQNCVQVMSSQQLGMAPHCQGMVSVSQGQIRPQSRHLQNSGPPDQQQVNSAKQFPPQPPSHLQPNSVHPYAQLSVGKLQEMQPCHPSIAHPQVSDPLATVSLSAQPCAASQESRHDSQQADSTTCSGKSSDDSGLSVTPDRSNPSPKHSHPPSVLAKTGAHDSSGMSLEGVNWSGVPSEVVQLLVQQDAQLKQLQAQIQQLLNNQQTSASSPTSEVSSPTPTPSAVSTPATLKKEMCSTAVNTTMLDPPARCTPDLATHCVSIQTSPQKHITAHPQASPSSSTHSDDKVQCQGRLMSPLHHSTASRVMERSSEAYSPYRQGSTGPEVLSVGPEALVLANRSNPAEDPVKSSSFNSSGSLQNPSPMRSMESHLQMSDSTPSPQSASMCVRQDEADEENREEQVSPDSKEYYDQLISNIRLLLNNHSQDAETSEADKTDAAATTLADETGLRLFDSTMAASPSMATSPSMAACPSRDVNNSSNTTMIPQINYLSMMLGSDSDTSLEINAMAMKYLRDEQLTQVARHHQSPQRSHQQLLRQVLAASLNSSSTSDISRLGAASNNMSMASRKYLERHGLLGGGQGESMLDSNQTIRLQTDFSLAVMSDSSNPSSQPSSPQKARMVQNGGVPSPMKRELLQPSFQPSPVIVEEENSFRERERIRMADLGASPALRPPQRYQRDPSPEDTPVFPDRYRAPRQQDLMSDCSYGTDDDRILDIEKLKQMPKLL